MQEAPKTLAVDFGGTGIKIAVTQGERILCKAPTLPTAAYRSPEEIMAAMCRSMQELLRQHPQAVAVGLGMPGWVDFYRGVLYQLTNVPVWDHEVPVRERIGDALGLPVVLDNDANCMGYAEWKLGAGKGLQNLACLTLGTGLGGCLVIHNRILRAKTVSCAELGQTSIDYAGRTGPFGNKGAIEEYIGNNEFAADAAQTYAAQGIKRTVQDCAPHILEAAARAGDPIAKHMFCSFAQKLATLVTNLMYTFAPEAIVIGGGVAKAGNLLFEPLQEQLKQQLFKVHYEALCIKPAYFGADAGLIGAGLMAADYHNGSLS